MIVEHKTVNPQTFNKDLLKALEDNRKRKFIYNWLDSLSGEILAYTKSEARGKIKKRLNIKGRLPNDVKIQEIY